MARTPDPMVPDDVDVDLRPAGDRRPAVAAERPDPATATRLSDLRNLGPATEAQLPQVGIATPAELAEVGAVEAYVRLKEAFPATVNLVYLWALDGALTDVRWDRIDPARKDELRAAVARAQGRRGGDADAPDGTDVDVP